MRTILIVDDDKEFTRSLTRVLGEEYAIEIAENPEEARKIFSPLKFDVVLLDICFNPETKDRQGIELLKEFKSEDPDISVIMMTAYGDIDTAVESLKIGAEDYIQKGKASLIDYKNRIELLFREGRLRRKVSRLQKEIEKFEPSEIIGEDIKIQEVRRQIRLVAEEGKTTVLIRGETGTGKELVARAIHREGIRREGPYVVVALSALNKETIASDLFGHEKGAYTGATGRRIGFIEEANGGILFLDEIGDLDLDIQVKLLRVIENREFVRMGSNRPIKVDIQLITATHRPLEKLIEEGKFREDLYYRLKAYVIELPPLRERKGDIPLLARHFLNLLIKQGRSTAHTISDEAMERLIAYNWPGNVRELKQTIENAVLNARLEGDEIITSKHLPLEIRSRKTEDGKWKIENGGKRIENGEWKIEDRKQKLEVRSIGERVAIYELELVKEAMEKTGGKKIAAAKMLGYSDRFALRRRVLAIFRKFPNLKNEHMDLYQKFVKK
ncbi:MAG: sigma-54 dependent transcriptional regulator [candidate division WOR-3 bacterium]